MVAESRFGVVRAPLVAGVLLAGCVVTGLAQDRRGRSETEARGAEEDARPEEFVRVTICGTLETGVFAIGGETTGTTITADRMRFELELGDDAELRRQAERLSGERALVTGRLTRREGVEIPERWIVKVQRIAVPEDAEGEGGR